MKKIVLVVLVLLIVLTGCVGNIKDGIALLEEAKYEEAIEAFQKDIEKERNLGDAYRGLGIAYFELEQYGDAAEAFQAALKHEEEETATICSLLGACYMELEEYEKALDAYENALVKEDITEEMEQEIQFNLIAVYEGMRNWDAAKSQVQKYVAAYPDDTRVEKEAEFLESR